MGALFVCVLPAINSTAQTACQRVDAQNAGRVLDARLKPRDVSAATLSANPATIRARAAIGACVGRAQTLLFFAATMIARRHGAEIVTNQKGC